MFLHRTVKFTYERLTTSVSFLDFNIQLKNNKIQTDLFCKPANKHHYLLHSSSLHRICSTETSFNLGSTGLKNYLTKRGYKEPFVRDQIRKAKQIPRNEALKERLHETKGTERIPFVVTYNPTLPNIQKILCKKRPILNASERLQKIFKETPVVAYLRSPNLSDLLVRATVKDSKSTPKTLPGTFSR